MIHIVLLFQMWRLYIFFSPFCRFSFSTMFFSHSKSLIILYSSISIVSFSLPCNLVSVTVLISVHMLGSYQFYACPNVSESCHMFQRSILLVCIYLVYMPCIKSQSTPLLGWTLNMRSTMYVQVLERGGGGWIGLYKKLCQF